VTCKCALVVILVLGFVGLSCATTRPMPLSESQPETAPLPRPLKIPGRVLGIVTAVDRESLTIQGLSIEFSGITETSHRWEGRSQLEAVTGNPLTVQSRIGLFYPDGNRPPVEEVRAVRAERRFRSLVSPDTITLTAEDGAVTVLRRSNQPPRTFEASDWLRAGGYSPRASGGNTYRLADVRVGDEVHLWLMQSDEYNLVDMITIARRPGGLVPPAPGERPDTKTRRIRHHEWMQMWQDWEEKGIPLPYDEHPGGPWPQLAPMPRELGLPAKP
jgi:hypothetical protein